MSFTLTAPPTGDQTARYTHLLQQLEGLLHGERDWVANAANASSLLWHTLPDLNWVGFYFLRAGARGDELIVGPFQGKPACVRIALGRGVCGTAAATGMTQVVPDVHAFPGHIACDAASRSEVVVPLVHAGRVVGVLDLDSPLPGRFDATDAAGLEQVAALFCAATDFG